MAGWDGNGLFTFTYNWVNDAANGIPITASRMDGQFNDAVSGFDNCLTRDNQGKPSANLLPDTDNAYTFGNQSFRWSKGYFVGIAGTTTNSAPASGDIGEYISSTVPSGSAGPITSATATNITSISLTAGDWDVWGYVETAPDAGTTQSGIEGWISTTSATLPTRPNNGGVTLLQLPFNATANIGIPVGQQRMLLAGTTTVYLSISCTFAVNTNNAFGFIGARRRR